jgi:hypothetical protein
LQPPVIFPSPSPSTEKLPAPAVGYKSAFFLDDLSARSTTMTVRVRRAISSTFAGLA